MLSLITDRTSSDVLNNTPKGNYQVSDINRVEGAVLHLRNLLSAIGYQNYITIKTDWTMDKLFYSEDGVRYVSNIAGLDASFCRDTTVQLPANANRLDYENANNIEKKLKVIEAYYYSTVSSFIPCGTITCGGDLL